MEWISVKDKLPEKDSTDVLVCNEKEGCAVAWYGPAGWSPYTDIIDTEGYDAIIIFDSPITHWMELPELPKQTNNH